MILESYVNFFQQDEIFRHFDFMVKPILCYGSEVWGTEYSDVIESVHFNFCKNFLGINNSVNNAVAIVSVAVFLFV